MSTILYSILGFIIAIGLLTTIHEYGHFWTARRLGIKVKRFSIGFGKALFKWHDKSGTQYAICLIPLGGYVKMLDQNEGQVPADELHMAFNRKPVWARMLVIAAGPAANLIFAVLAYWVVFMWGISAIMPVIGEVPPDTVAYRAGLHAQQEIISVGGNDTNTWEEVVLALVSRVGEHNQISLQVRDVNDNAVSTHVLNLSNWSMHDADPNLLNDLGLIPYDPLKPVIGKVLADYPAAKAGLQEGDLIVSLNGATIHSITQLMILLENKYDQHVTLGVIRDKQHIICNLIPAKKIHENGTTTGFIGIQFAKQVWPANFVRIHTYTPVSAFAMAIQRTTDYITVTLQFLGHMLTGKMSLQHISGPIAIAQYAGLTVRAGIENFISFLALVSISLGVLNMLPIPVLDGGHFLFCMIELIRGKALSVRAMNVGVVFGLIILGSVMLLAVYNDVLRLMH